MDVRALRTAGRAVRVLSAAVWGGGDFTGGLATRRSNQFYVLALSSLSGIVILLICVLLTRERFRPGGAAFGPRWPGHPARWGSPRSIVPFRWVTRPPLRRRPRSSARRCRSLSSAITEGLQAPTRLAGFVLAFIGIGLVTGSMAAGDKVSRQGFLLACLAGVGFGAFSSCWARSSRARSSRRC